MLSNAQIAATLDELADLLEFQGANAFRVRAYRNGARAVRNLSQAVAQLVEEDPRQLTDIEGIGQSVAEKCVTLVQTGRLPQLEALLEEIPESVLTLLRIPGLGPKKAAVLFQQLGVATLDQLRAACESQQVRALKGFGAKTEQAILDGMHLAETAGQRVYWAEADEIVAAPARASADLPGGGAVGVCRQLPARQGNSRRSGCSRDLDRCAPGDGLPRDVRVGRGDSRAW